MFNALSVVKFAVSGVVGIGTGKIVHSVIRNHVTPETLVDKVSIISAGWVIAAMATKATKEHSDEIISDTYDSVVKIVDQFKKKAQLDRINKGQSTFETEGLNKEDFEMDAEGAWTPRVSVETPTAS